ncbi:MAG: ribbon-helix-helix domain-containing protein [Sporichthyaceae bacterium]
MSGDTERDERDYQHAADWAEHDMALKPDSRTALRGAAAAEHGRALLERATGGRPPLDPNAAPGQHSPVRQVRLPADLNEQLDAVAAAEHRRPSDVIRSALADYLAARSAG